jgi:glutaredoxin-related protein
VGGLDIVKEMMESGEWDEVVGGDEEQDESHEEVKA